MKFNIKKLQWENGVLIWIWIFEFLLHKIDHETN
jgi:hypothetical protein